MARKLTANQKAYINRCIDEAKQRTKLYNIVDVMTLSEYSQFNMGMLESMNDYETIVQDADRFISDSIPL